MSNPAPQPPAVQRQIKLPMSKAVDIAYKSIRLRLSRSLLVTSGIVLALAFLISISASEAMIGGMRSWIDSTEKSKRFEDLRAERTKLEAEVHPREAALRKSVRENGKPAKDAPEYDVKKLLGMELDEFKQQYPDLPVSVGDLQASLTANAAKVEPPLKEWLETAKKLHDIKAELTAPQQLAAMMKSNGVPTTPAEIENQKIQTHWLLGLALLVAFVGILNAMLMSVTERFREIGTMKCLGALDGFIIKLFLIESLFQGGVGTVIGLILGLMLSMLAATTSYGSYAWVNVPWKELVIASGFALIVGMVLTVGGALYPAIQAAKMQPIEAMRSDV